MSTIKVTNINNASAASGGIAFDADGHVTVDGLQLPSAGALSNRNLIINGAMQVAQRGTSQTGVTSVTYAGPDRYLHIITQGAFTISQSTTAPGGFSNSTKYDCTTAATLTTTNAVVMQQRIEAQNLQHLKFGTSSAEELTLSFWVRSNLTGVFTVEAYIDDDGRQISREVTISSANTWEYKTVSIPGDTVGVIDNDTGPGMDINFWLDSGPDRKTGTLNTSGWASSVEANRVSNSNISFAASTANEFYLTGVQLEVGSTATPFEHRSYGDELQRCERYFQQWKGDGALSSQNVIAGCGCINPGYSAVFLAPSPKMRGPFDVAFDNLIVSDSASYDSNVTNIGLTNASGDGAYIAVSYGSNGTRGDAQSLRVKASTAGFLQLEAEL